MRFFGKCVSICLIALFFAVVFLTVAFADSGDGYGDKIESFDVSRDESSSVTVNLYRKDGQYFLVVSGEGNMREFSSFAELPWGEYADGIVGITVEAGVKNLTDLFLYNCSALEELWVYERYLTFIADKQYIPFAVKIYGHFNSTAHLFVYENYPERFFPICDFKDGVCAECEFVCENHSGGVPSCTENGKCRICGVEYIFETGHSLSELIGEVPATCYSVGVLAHYACLECGELFDSNNQPTTKEALEFTRDHAYGELREYTAPTCTAPGFIAHYECSLCLGNFNEDREKIDDIFISAVGHIGGTATCLSGAVCESCDAVYTDPDLTNHSYGVALRYDESTHWKECICGAKSSLCGHILSDKILEEPTESEMGILDSSCVCGYNTRKYIPKLPLKAEGNIENANPFPPLKLIIITASAILLCICVAAIVIIVRKLKKQ